MNAFRFAPVLAKPSSPIERVVVPFLMDLKNAPPVMIQIPAVVAVAVAGLSLLALARLAKR